MNKFFVMSDIHSFADEMFKALNDKGFDKSNKDHYLIVCGDLFDRGKKPLEVLKFVQSLGDRFIYVRGNHEDLLFECVDEMIHGYEPSSHHWHNGTFDTILGLCDLTRDDYWRMQVNAINDNNVFSVIEERMKPYLDFINKKSINYFETKNNIFVHGWIPGKPDPNNDLSYYDVYGKYDIYDDNWRTSSFWEYARWKNGMQQYQRGVKEPNKTIICGHWHCSWGWSNLLHQREEFPKKTEGDWLKSFEPFIDDGIVALDACTAYSGICNCIVIEDEEL